MSLAHWKAVQNENTRALLSGKTKGGVQADAHVDGRARWWSWGCSKCGDYEDQINDRATARREYAEHKKSCTGEPE